MELKQVKFGCLSSPLLLYLSGWFLRSFFPQQLFLLKPAEDNIHQQLHIFSMSASGWKQPSDKSIWATFCPLNWFLAAEGHSSSSSIEAPLAKPNILRKGSDGPEKDVHPGGKVCFYPGFGHSWSRAFLLKETFIYQQISFMRGWWIIRSFSLFSGAKCLFCCKYQTKGQRLTNMKQDKTQIISQNIKKKSWSAKLTWASIIIVEPPHVL